MEIGKVPEECERITVPRLIIQPLVENVFEHSLKTMPEKGYLRVNFMNEPDYLVVTVEDNGENIDDGSILDLQEKLDELNKDVFKNSNGVANVHRRLRIRFGHNSGIQFEKSSLGGLKVNMFIYKER